MPTVRFGHTDYESPNPLGEMAAKSVASFNRATNGTEYPTLEEALRQWTAQLFHKGQSRLTVKRYLQSLRTVYESISPQESGTISPFTLILDEINSSTESGTTADQSGGTAHTLVTTTRRLSDPQRLYLDAFLFMIYTRGMLPEQLLKAKRSATATSSLPAQAKAIAEAHRAPGQRTIFSFPSGETAATLLQRIDAVVNHILSPRSLPLTPHSATTLWIEAAIECGIRYEEIRACVASLPESYSWLRFIKPTALSPDEIRDITARVADHINPDRSYWYAMKMRAGVTPATVKTALRRLAIPSPVNEYFYPCEEIARRTGHKLTYQGVPLIADILFFRTRPTDIAPMFHHIGDKAWCYRDGGKNGGPYSIIPDADMLRFQRNIGIFSSSFDFAPIGTHPIADGQRVRITGGPLSGYEGIVHRLVSPTANATTRVFRLAILGNLGIEWTATIDERLLEPLS